MDFPTEDVLAFWFQDGRHDIKPPLSDIAFGSGRERARYHHSRPLYPVHLRQQNSSEH